MFHELSSKSDEKIFTFSQNLKERFNWLDEYTEEIMKTLGVTSSDGPILVPKVIVSCVVRSFFCISRLVFLDSWQEGCKRTSER